ncbi:hypothetical protein C0995_004643 [Termitomyces sp. Mi166|nr:hypothetical protein C0995_004643 [Termitomyces sp. Mi166\
MLVEVVEGVKKEVEDNEEKARLFHKAFFYGNLEEAEAREEEYPEPAFKWTWIEDKKIYVAINKLRLHKAPGLSSIPNIVLKKRNTVGHGGKGPVIVREDETGTLHRKDEPAPKIPIWRKARVLNNRFTVNLDEFHQECMEAEEGSGAGVYGCKRSIPKHGTECVGMGHEEEGDTKGSGAVVQEEAKQKEDNHFSGQWT